MIINKKIIVFLCAAIACGALLWAFKSYFSVVNKPTNQLVVGTCSGFPPYEMLDDHGGLIGFDIDVAHALAQKMHKVAVFKDMAFDSLVLALNQGTIDMIIAGVSITKTKLQKIALVHYQGEAIAHIPLLFWQHIPAGVTTIADLQKLPNKTVCVQAGNFEEEVLAQYHFLTLKQLDGISELILDIKYGKSIAATVDPAVADSLLYEIPELKVLAVPLNVDEQTRGQGIGIAKHNQALIAHTQKIMQQLKHEGVLVALEAKWFKKGQTHGSN